MQQADRWSWAPLFFCDFLLISNFSFVFFFEIAKKSTISLLCTAHTMALLVLLSTCVATAAAAATGTAQIAFPPPFKPIDSSAENFIPANDKVCHECNM
jgi:hypothetical protein